VQETPAPTDDEGEFVAAMVGTIETLWNDIFTQTGLDYEEPTLVLFSGSTQSGCGGATAVTGPHYCPLHETIYIDLDFFDTLQTRFGASGGDSAEAYVIAHEVAHHVQNLLGVSDQVNQISQQDPSQRNPLSVRLELQADWIAGVWANSIFQRGNVLEPGDIEESLSAAAAVGDDRIQERSTAASIRNRGPVARRSSGSNGSRPDTRRAIPTPATRSAPEPRFPCGAGLDPPITDVTSEGDLPPW
jgi:predicted metalloprotease